MWQYNYSRELRHSGTSGMRWGYNDGKKNGKRTAMYEVGERPGYEWKSQNELIEDLQEPGKRYNEHVKKVTKAAKEYGLKNSKVFRFIDRILNTPIYQLIKGD